MEQLMAKINGRSTGISCTHCIPALVLASCCGTFWDLHSRILHIHICAENPTATQQIHICIYNSILAQSRKWYRDDTVLILCVEADWPLSIVSSAFLNPAPSSGWQATGQWSRQTHTCHESCLWHLITKWSVAQIWFQTFIQFLKHNFLTISRTCLCVFCVEKVNWYSSRIMEICCSCLTDQARKMWLLETNHIPLGEFIYLNFIKCNKNW